MKPIEVTFTDAACAEARRSLERILSVTDDIESFISHWFLGEQGSIAFVAGSDNATRSVPCMCLIVQDDQEPIAELCYPIQQLRLRFPDVRPVDSFVAAVDAEGRCVLDEELLDSFEESLGYEYHEELCGRLGPRESLLKIALSYVLANRGEAQLSHYEPPGALMPLEDAEQLNPKNIMSLRLIYLAPETRRGVAPMFGNFLYVHAEREQAC